MSEELKPCPFCGEKIENLADAFTAKGRTTKWASVSCCCNGPEVRTGYQDDGPWKDEAVRAWNTRPIESRLESERDEARRDLASAQAELAEAMAEPTKKPLVTYEHEGYHGRWISDTDHENRMCAIRGERNRARKELTEARAEIARLTISLEASQGALRDTIRQMADYAKGTERMTRQRDNARIERNECSAEIARRDGQINTLRDMHAADAKEIARLNALVEAKAEGVDSGAGRSEGGVMEITKEILEVRLLMQQHSLEEARKFRRVADANYIALELDITRLALAALSRREAEEGEVVVDGTVSASQTTVYLDHRLDSFERRERVTVTIRRRAEKAKGGEGDE